MTASPRRSDPARRTSFDQDAERYHRARPGYDDALVDELVSRAGLRPGDRVLEIAPGTGKLTLPLAERGLDVTGVELGAEMAAIGRRTLAGRPNARIVPGEFETWPLPAEPFDAVTVASAYHWLDPEVRLPRIAAALRPGGTFARIRNRHVPGPDPEFAERLHEIQQRWRPDDAEPGTRRTEPEDAPPDTAEIDASGLFAPAEASRHALDLAYTADEYLDLLGTYSGNIVMEPERRAGLFREIAALVDSRPGGRVTRRYLRELVSARRLPSPPPTS